MSAPLVTIIMSVYNGSNCVSDAIDSVMGQSFKDFEFIITDDGSTDETPRILDEYAKKDKRIKIIHQKNLGLTESLNRMIKASKGEFIARMDADDASMPERLERQVEKLMENPDCLMLGCWFRTVFEDHELGYETIFPDNTGLLKEHLHKGMNCYAHGSVMIRKKVFDEMGLCYRFRYGQDLDLWLRISEAGKIGMVEDILYERMDNSQTLSKSLVPRRIALARLMLRLSGERLKHGREITDWSVEEKNIFKDVPLWGEKEIAAYEGFLKARSLLCNGRSKEAKALLQSLKREIEGLGNFSSVYLLSHLPGPIIGPALRLRDSFNDRRQFKRKARA